MPEIIYDITQNTPEWIYLRLGSVGGTIIDKIAPRGKEYKNALYYLAGEIITGVPAESHWFKHAERGHIYEPIARAAYTLRTGNEVKQCALIKGDKPHTHISPDGIIGATGLLEIKTRTPSVFLAAKDGHFPLADKRQIAWGLSVSGREWYERVQFCPEIDRVGSDGIIIERINVYTRIEVDRKKMKMIDLMVELEEVADKFISDMMALVDRNGL